MSGDKKRERDDDDTASSIVGDFFGIIVSILLGVFES